MDSPKPLILKSRTTVSLHERFTQVLMDQLTPTMTFNPILLIKEEPPFGIQAPHFHQRATCHLRKRRRRRRRRSLWTHDHTSKFRGYWSFMSKYRLQGRGHLRSRLGQHRVLRRRRRSHVHRLTGRHLNVKLPRGMASTTRGRGLSNDSIPTKRQLDAQLDDYMSVSRRRLDKELDDYMSMSRRRLDKELDEYMCLLED
ncbi:hypothetical protein JOB18_002286 [Solea senegalensis]|uniref:Chromatin target of PRMT1 protein C-terminal domain-containing protein n=2 Tax=Solea senegalensis TaxID=28829 RepID=A0AAV6PN79_SOLSE|nr:uncharacterized protein LOC122775196 isoform X2 [Solea senegalensis]XP_043890940.1 uncharacterized protein LOC122775196 isoform X2 [Solea senegalensis]XP_043890941.1 uncharacterized protein LOC122775196 isoform X2 [Solea senegalensis]KAG7474109.1 hypothetical protein JOB18_002286 [Solea senegalensis]